MLLVLFNTVQAQIWARMRRWAQIFARAAYGGAQKHAENDMDIRTALLCRLYDIDLQNYRQLLSKFEQSHSRNWSKLAKKGSWGASGAPGGPNVGEASLTLRFCCSESLVLFCC